MKNEDKGNVFRSGLRVIISNHPEFFEDSAPIVSCYDLSESNGKYNLVVFERCNIPEEIKQEIYNLYLAIFDESLRY
jgi:hypothetical protein